MKKRVKANVIQDVRRRLSQDGSSASTSLFTTATSPPSVLPTIALAETEFSNSIDVSVSGWFSTGGSFNFYAKILVTRIENSPWPVGETVSIQADVSMLSQIVGSFTILLSAYEFELVWDHAVELTNS